MWSPIGLGHRKEEMDCFLEQSMYYLLPRAEPAKKAKKVNQLETQVVDPASFDSPEAKPVTAWRVDRLKKISYTQLWFLIKERKVKKVRFSLHAGTRLAIYPKRLWLLCQQYSARNKGDAAEGIVCFLASMSTGCPLHACILWGI